MSTCFMMIRQKIQLLLSTSCCASESALILASTTIHTQPKSEFYIFVFVFVLFCVIYQLV
jgi:hypothetical protein